MILQTIFVVFGLVLFIDAIFDKWNVWNRIAEIGSKQSREFIFRMANCRFCLLFHIGWIVTLMVGIATGFSWPLLVVTFVVGGFIHLINKK